MRKLFTLLFAVLASVGTLFAWDYERVQIGDLYYNLDASTQTAQVTSQNSGGPYLWTTVITTADIPSSVIYNAVTYSVTGIGEYAFCQCGLISVTIPSSVTYIGESAFCYCIGLTSVTIPNSVTSIGNRAFLGCDGLTSMTIPNNVTYIGESAFELCSGITSLTIPSSVSSIGDGAFSIVANIVYNGEATGSPWGARSMNGYIEDYLVYSDEAKTNLLACSTAAKGEIIIPSSVTSIGDYAFYSCTGLASVTIGNSVISIGKEAFRNCSGLTSVTIPNSVTSIGNNAFEYCIGLTSIEIPNSVTSIGNRAFSGCRGLTSVTIPNSVTYIGGLAFSGCSSLTSVTIPNSVTSIGDGAFDGCSKLTSVTIPNSVASIGEEAFLMDTSLISVAIPNNITSIRNRTFSGCSGLTSITIPNSVTSIGEDAFAGCSSLASVTIGDNVTSIGSYAFYGCRNLTSITCEATTPPTCAESVFNDVNRSIPLYVPAESVELYKAADVWKEFTNIQAITKTTNTAELWPLIMDNQTYSNLEQYIVSDLRPDDIENHFYIFPLNTGELTYTANNTSGLNSCGNGEGYLALSVESFGWAGCGLCIEKQASISALQSLKEAIVTNPDNYYLHLSIKSTDSYSHCFYIMGNEATKFVLGNKSVYDGPVYSDFARDGEWHEFYIPLAQYASALDTTDIASGIFEFIALTEGVGGGQLNLDAVFFCNAEFKDGNFILPSSNKCGDNLTWKFDQQTGTLTISGSGAMYDYSYQNKAPWQDYKEAIRSIVLPNGLTTIGAWTFNECSNLSQISIPQNVTSIGDYAFEGCVALTSIINYANTPQSIDIYVFGRYEAAVSKSICILYVPAPSISLYKEADGWKEFENIVPIQASEANVTEVKVTPSATTADIAWPVISDAASYELVIKDKDGNVICTLTFNAQGQLITLAFNAPARKHTPQQKQAAGFQFTVTGLKAGTAYDYIIVSKDENGQVLDTQNGSFTTTDTPTGIDNTPFPSCEDQDEALKILHDGQIFILRGDKSYTLTGQEVK